MTATQYFFSYFPQFHTDPINNRAWGEGFTDWDLICALPEMEREKFTPLRGYYDPSSAEYLQTLRAQLDEVPLPNVGLMVYHYYFDGTYALSGFEKQLLAQPDLCPPFFLCWANETWSKRWVGLPGDVLIEQRHLEDAALIKAHASYLCQFFELRQYRRVEGRPLFMIYDAQASASLPNVVTMYRDAFAALGHSPLIGTCLGYPQSPSQLQPYDFGCEFQPRFLFNSVSSASALRVAARLKMRFPRLFEWIGGQRDRLRKLDGRRSFAYENYLAGLRDGRIERQLRSSVGKTPLMRSAFLSWDNTPRYRDRSTTVTHGNVTNESLSELGKVHSDGDFPLLLNSWNEWSEGAALEPGRAENGLRAAFFQALQVE